MDVLEVIQCGWGLDKAHVLLMRYGNGDNYGTHDKGKLGVPRINVRGLDTDECTHGWWIGTEWLNSTDERAQLFKARRCQMMERDLNLTCTPETERLLWGPDYMKLALHKQGAKTLNQDIDSDPSLAQIRPTGSSRETLVVPLLRFYVTMDDFIKTDSQYINTCRGLETYGAHDHDKYRELCKFPFVGEGQAFFIP